VPANEQFRERECGFEGLKSANSLYFSLLAGNSGGEGLAPDCALRHSVWTVENPGYMALRIAENPRDSATFHAQPGTGESVPLYLKGKFRAFFSEGHCGSPVSSTPPGEYNAITNR
jgi:hypothetical protein